MHPIFFTFPKVIPLVGGHSIHIYGLMIAIGFLLGIWWTKRESKIVGLDPNRMMDLLFYLMVTGLVGSRILYVVHSVPNFWSDPLIFFRVWEGGLVFQGGVIACVITGIWLVKKYKIPFFKAADVFAPALSLGHGLGRLGCFFAGCCFGKQCDINFPLAIVFPKIAEGVAPHGIPLYPTQLGEFFGEMIILITLILYRKKKKFNGSVFLIYMILYSILRSVIELFRGDLIRGFIIEPYLSNGQFISLLSILLAVFFWIYLTKQAKKQL